MNIYMNYSIHIMTSSSFLVTKKMLYPTAQWRHKTKLQDNKNFITTDYSKCKNIVKMKCQLIYYARDIKGEIEVENCERKANEKALDVNKLSAFWMASFEVNRKSLG
ncbi:hypothetical protein ACKWTF_006558 [Chironomus riparius]